LRHYTTDRILFILSCWDYYNSKSS